MGSFNRPHAFDPLDMEIIDLVYEVAWEQILAQKPSTIRWTMKSDRHRYASGCLLSLATAELISILCSTECSRAYRSR